MSGFRDLLNQYLTENFTDIAGREVDSDLTDESKGKELGRHINRGTAHELATAAAHPNAEEWHLDKALDHGGLDQIVAAHPKAPLRFLKRILSRSTDEMARMAASHNRNMTSRALEIAYANEKSPRVQAEMLRSRHMPEMFLKTEAASELLKEHPSTYKLDAIAANINSPKETVNSINRRRKVEGAGYLAAEGENPEKAKLFSELKKVVSEVGLPNKHSIGSVNIKHSRNGNGLVIEAEHEYSGMGPHAAYNKQRKTWDDVHSKVDDLLDDEFVRKHFDPVVSKISIGRVGAEAARDKKEGNSDYSQPHKHGTTVRLELKPEFQ